MQFGVKKTSVFWLPYGETVFWLPYGETAWSYIHNTYHVLTHYPRMIDGQPDKQSDMPIIDLLFVLCTAMLHNTYHVLTHPRMIDGQPDKQSDMPIIDLCCLCSAQLCYASVCKNDDLHRVLMSILQAGYTDSMNQMNARFSG